jgi:hypothetical protein
VLFWISKVTPATTVGDAEAVLELDVVEEAVEDVKLLEELLELVEPTLDVLELVVLDIVEFV